MNVEKIEKLDELIELDEDSTIVEQKIKRLTAPGENYGSLMLSIDIKIKTPNGNEEIHSVAKMVPPNEFLQQVFNTQVSFRNEIAFYNNIVPTLKKFQREQGMENLIDFFPEYYGSRINLTGGSKVDNDAVLLLENLKESGYVNFDRTKGFDLETAKLIVKDIAHLHAVPIALKLKKPDVFDKEIRVYLGKFEPPESEDEHKKFFDFLDSIKEMEPFLERIKAVMPIARERRNSVREPFATISHNDVWVNNTMVKIEEGKSVKNKLVDFQVCQYASAARDLIFFIFSSVQNDIMIKHCDDLINLYHETFVQILKDLNCSTEQFSFENFMKEIIFEAKGEFLHTIFMFFPIFMPKGTQVELSEIKPDDFMKNASDPPKEHVEKLILVVKEFVRRNWI